MAEHVLPLAVAHRGGNEVAHENTLEAFQDAIDLGYRRIETDVHSTRHGELLAIHGQTIDGSEAIETGVDAYVHIGERAIRIADLTRADLYWLLGTSVRESGPLDCHRQPLFLCQGNSAIDPGGESFSFTRENRVVWAADSHERHARTAGESCKRPLEA